MTVRQWMASDPVVVDPTVEVHEARATMQRNGIRHLPVVRDGVLIGIVSDRDVRIDAGSLEACGSIEGVKDVSGHGREVSSVMATSVHHIGPDASVGDAARVMMSRHISAVPVVEDGRLVGIITTTDCLLAALTADPDLGSGAGSRAP
ncbi:CBS domain-containing protein [Euzebya rosea]|uniref:CBS domain-containing protein n=1 Tax=Euzebya rosea TaxID=2052804 RepID=UPI001475CB09|nr:CBS domain-containing protein [Euzebya rosea]